MRWLGIAVLCVALGDVTQQAQMTAPGWAKITSEKMLTL
ncbi:hypothetical protein ABID59_001939 [Bradyrhizobium sp. S3.3.6]